MIFNIEDSFWWQIGFVLFGRSKLKNNQEKQKIIRRSGSLYSKPVYDIIDFGFLL